MMNGYNNTNPMDSNNYPANGGGVGTPPDQSLMNNYAQEYLNTVKENRSMYGNYVDNNLTYDPYKEQKSVYNVVYETDAYNPWGKPGGGAPKVDNTGNVATKIVGTLKWNLNGETEEDRAKRLANGKQANKNALMYKKNPPSPQMTPRHDTRQTTTYNYNYRDPFMNSAQGFYPPGMPGGPNPAQMSPPHTANYQQMPNSQSQQAFNEMTKIEREAEMRNLQRNNSMAKSNSNPAVSSRGSNMRRSDHELNRISNKLYNDNQPTVDYPNNPYWFGRTGPNPASPSSKRAFLGSQAAQPPTTAPNNQDPSNDIYYDARKRNLLDALEGRIQNPYVQAYSNFNSNSQYV